MTWTKLSDDYDVQCADLSDAAYRTHNQGLIWCMRRETDGAIAKRDVARFADTPDPYTAVEELIAKGFWEEFGNGYMVRHHMEHQPESDIMAKRRELTADRVRKHRRRKAGLTDDCNAVTGCVTERVTRDGTGLVGTGKPQTQSGQEEVMDAAWAGMAVEDLPCEFCGSRGPTLVDEFERRVCVGACAQDTL